MTLKVLHIIQDTELAGSQRIALDILRGLPSSGFDKVVVTGLSTAHEKEFLAQANEAGARVVRVPSFQRAYGPGDIVALRDLTRACRRESPHVVHTHSAKPFVLGRAAARLAGVPSLVHTLHGISFHAQQPAPQRALYWTLENLGAALGGMVVSVNRCYTEAFLGVRASRWRVIPNGVDPASGPSGDPPPLPPGPRMVLFPSRLSPQKDPIGFLRAAELVLQDPELADLAVFELAGAGPLHREVEAFVEQRPLLRDRVTLHGWVHDLRPLYARAWAVCVPSRWEAFGLVVAEAALWAVPAVTSDAEGLPEVVVDGETGSLSPVGDVPALAVNLRRVLLDPALRHRLGQGARRRVTTHFTLDAMQERYRDLYRELDRGRSGAA